MIQEVTPKEAFEALRHGEAVSIDVRSHAEYQTGHIEGSQNIDFYNPSFQEEVNALDREKSYIINCLSGGRSGRTVLLMESLGFRNVKNLMGGITEWRGEGFPVVTE